MRYKRREFAAESVILAFITIVYLFMEYQKDFFDESIYSITDSWITMMTPIAYTVLVVPVLMVGMAYGMRNDFLGSSLLRYGSKRGMLTEQCKWAVLRSAQLAGVYLLIIWLFGRIKGRVFCNWNQVNSYFFMKNRCVFEGNIAEIILVIFSLCLLRNLLLCMMLILSKWYFKNIVSGFFFPIGICIFEIAQNCVSGTENLRIFLKKCMADYPFWISMRQRAGLILYLLVCGICFYFLMEYILEKKEFFHEKKC